MDSFAKIYADENMQKLIRILDCTTNKCNTNPLLDKCNVDCNEVYPNLFISNAEAAKNLEFLKSIGITHLLNAAQGNDFLMTVNTNADYYKDSGIKYLGLELIDFCSVSISPYIQQAADFIEEGLDSGGKVLVHCVMGISRSSTCVIAYLMIKKHLSVEEAIQQIKNHRDIRPNNGFLVQLVELDRKLRSKS